MIGNILRQRYKIIKQLGAGGFGETFLAEDLDIPVTPKPICVVKKLHPTIIDPEIIRLFEQEAQILYKLGQNHDQIPKLSGYFQEDQDFYLIQEFIDGYNLTQEISPGKKLSAGDVIQLLRDVLEILVYVHENNVIHRDIKPANIMLRKDGKLVLIDFGVVKQINTTIAIKSGVTSRTVGIGTHGYMPSEQAIGKPKLSSDIYALGMTAIEALTGISLNSLSEDEEGEIIWSNLVSVSNKLENFITKMVRYDWRQRYRDAKEALEALKLNQVLLINKSSSISRLVPVKLNSKYGYISKDKLVIYPQFDDALHFSEGLAPVEINKKWGFINTSGQLVIPCEFDIASSFCEGLASVRINQKGKFFTYNKKWGFINTSGRLVISYEFDIASSFCEGLSRVTMNGKCGFINTNGQLVIPYKFDQADSFSEGLAKVEMNGKYGYINTSGKLIIDCKFDIASSFYDGLARVRINKKWGFINTNGQLVIPCEFDRTSIQFKNGFSEGLAKVEMNRKWGFINTNGQLVIPYQFDETLSFSEGLASVKMNGEWGFINTSGQLVIPHQFDYSLYSSGLGKFSEGLAKVKIMYQCGFINTIGDLVIPCQFDEADSFQEGLAKVRIKDQEHLIDKTGKIVY